MQGWLRKPDLGTMGTLLVSSAVRAQIWWQEWALTPQHTDQVTLAQQPLDTILASIVYDPLVPAELAANGDNLLAHYQVPLTDVSIIYKEFKSGTYSKNTHSTEIWGGNAVQLQNGNLSKPGASPATGGASSRQERSGIRQQRRW